MAQKFKKHPNFMGKYMSLYVGGGDKVIGDHDILEGPQWGKYVGMGMLVPVVETPKVEVVTKKDPVVVVPPPPPPPPPPPVVVEQKQAPEEEKTVEVQVVIIPDVESEKVEFAEGVTKSPAAKWGTKRRKKDE